ncbi:MAG: hypothetical protein AAF682_06515 [Planctomycetota bacterium]
MSAEGSLDPRRLRRAPLYLAIFAACFAATAVAVRAWIPMPPHYDLQDKLRYFAEHKDEFDLVFVGSSATFRNFVPEVVDEGLAAEGLEVRSFNFGVVGFRSFETDYMVRWILAQEPARLKWIVLEPPPFDPPFDYTGLQASKTELAVHSHTLEETELILRSVWLADLEPRVKYDESIRHLKLLGMNLGNIGRGPAALQAHLDRDPDWVAPPWLADGRGFQAVEDRPGFKEPAPDKDPLRDRAAYRDRAVAMEAANRAGASLERYNFTALRRQIGAIRGAGVEPIYCLSPMVFAMPEALALDELGELPNFLPFHLPKTYANLFRPELRIDLTHYRREGASQFSRFLAPRLAEILKRTAP